MITIKLPAGTYDYDPSKPLGKAGGFGQVFLGSTSTGVQIAVKRLHVTAADAAHRELRVADELIGRKFEHVVPFIDAGEDADTGDYFVVMPKADGNLSRQVEQMGTMDSKAAAECIMEIVRGLIEVGDLVHRDLKPDNILRHDENWKIADFGIARFTAEVTAPNTLKDFLSRDYAAPEQWKLERATHATDVYALGCIGFFLFSGVPPYYKSKDHSHDHQFTPLPPFSCADSRLKSLILMMTRKNAPTRPSLQRVATLLQTIIDTPAAPVSGGGGLLADAASAVLQKEEAMKAQKSLADAKEVARNQLAKDAFDILSENCERLWGKVHHNAPNAVRPKNSNQFECRVGSGALVINLSRTNIVPPGAFKESKWDVVAMSEALVTQTGNQYAWSASLWYMKINPKDDYRWYEVSYWNPLGRKRHYEPFACSDFKDADYAASNIMHSVYKAFGPVVVDDEMEGDFHDRWMWLLSRAAIGHLRSPSSLPIKSWPPQM